MIQDHKDLDILSKSELVSIMTLATLTKIEDLERDRLEKLNQMNEANLPYYLEAQDQTIKNWRQFLKQLQKYKNQQSSCVEDGALVKVSGYPASKWVFIFKFRSTLSVEGTTVTIDDGQLGRLKGTLCGARPGDTISLMGDERGLSDMTVQVLKVL
jgi:hypothetical protein